MQPNYSSSHQIIVKEISKAYVLDAFRSVVIHNTSCTIERGKMTFIYGPSGSGKSTFLNMLGLLDKPTSGHIFINGIDITTLSDSQSADFRAKNIGFIFQSFNLLPVLSAGENVEFPLLNSRLSKKQQRERAAYYLSQVGLGDYYSRSLGNMSGGQRQRVAIARALVSQPKLVIADEPTANLDQRTSDDIMKLMVSIQQQHKTTFLICTHNTKLIEHAEHLIQIVDGSLHKQR